MTTFTELQDAVITLTKRPDLVNETSLALKRAIVKEHSALDYPRDLSSMVATLSQPSPNNYRYTLSLATLGLYPQCRKIKLIREYITPQVDQNNSAQGYFGQIDFTKLEPDNLFDGYNMEKHNYFYQAGQTLNLAAQRQVDYVLLMYYLVPSTANTGAYSDWMADMYPYLIYTHAAAEIFRLIGKSEEQKMQLSMLADHRFDVIKNEIGD